MTKTSIINAENESQLSPTEQNALAKYESVIEKGWKTFVEVGKALAAIRDKRLYRGQFQTFERYCQERWDFCRDYAYKLIGAAETVQELSALADVPLPTNEAQVRPLIGLTNSKLKDTWLSVVRSANGQRITARLVKEKTSEAIGRNGHSNLASMRSTTKGFRKLRENIQLNCYLDDLERSVRMGKPDEVILGLIKEIRQWLESTG